MVCFDHIFDGLEVAVDRVFVRNDRGAAKSPAAVSPSRGAAGGRAGCATLRQSPGHLALFTPRMGALTSAGTGASVLVEFRATCLGSLGLFDGLPEPLVADLRGGDPLGGCFESLIEETEERGPGWRPMADALLRQCLILLLRRCRGGEEVWPWLTRLGKDGLARAVGAMREAPERPFTLATLAEIAGMSRSVFAARFSGTLAVPPMEFLTALRLERAAQLLRRTDLPVKAIAHRVGYTSRSSFSRAFQLRHRIGPVAFRAVGPDAAAAAPVKRRAERSALTCSTPRRASDVVDVDWTDTIDDAVSF